MAAKTNLCDAQLSRRETKQHQAAIAAHGRRIDEPVFAFYGVNGLPRE